MLEVHVLASGSDGNCTVVRLDDEAVMIDAGLSFKQTHRLMELEGIDESAVKALLITHEHGDHVKGAGAVARKLGVPLYANRETFTAFDAGRMDWREFRIMDSFSLCGMEVTPLPTFHDAVNPCAFMLRAGGSSVLVATDTGKLSFQCERALEEADLAIIEANYDSRMLRDGPYPEPLKRRIASDRGHMCNSVTAQEIRKTAVNERRQIFLAHLSKNNNTPDIARQTVADITGIKRFKIDCLERLGDTRTLTVSRRGVDPHGDPAVLHRPRHHRRHPDYLLLAQGVVAVRAGERRHVLGDAHENVIRIRGGRSLPRGRCCAEGHRVVRGHGVELVVGGLRVRLVELQALVDGGELLGRGGRRGGGLHDDLLDLPLLDGGLLRLGHELLRPVLLAVREPAEYALMLPGGLEDLGVVAPLLLGEHVHGVVSAHGSAEGHVADLLHAHLHDLLGELQPLAAALVRALRHDGVRVLREEVAVLVPLALQEHGQRGVQVGPHGGQRAGFLLHPVDLRKIPDGHRVPQPLAHNGRP